VFRATLTPREKADEPAEGLRERIVRFWVTVGNLRPRASAQAPPALLCQKQNTGGLRRMSAPRELREIAGDIFVRTGAIAACPKHPG
jgi:hypothetical protein